MTKPLVLHSENAWILVSELGGHYWSAGRLLENVTKRWVENMTKEGVSKQVEIKFSKTERRENWGFGYTNWNKRSQKVIGNSMTTILSPLPWFRMPSPAFQRWAYVIISFLVCFKIILYFIRPTITSLVGSHLLHSPSLRLVPQTSLYVLCCQHPPAHNVS